MGRRYIGGPQINAPTLARNLMTGLCDYIRLHGKGESGCPLSDSKLGRFLGIIWMSPM